MKKRGRAEGGRTGRDWWNMAVARGTKAKKKGGRYQGASADLRWNLISLMGETFPASEVISLELSHRVSDFWLIAPPPPPLRTTQTPLNPPRPEGCFYSFLFFLFLFFFFFFTRVNSRKEKRKREKERLKWTWSVFFNHAEKKLKRVAS